MGKNEDRQAYIDAVELTKAAIESCAGGSAGVVGHPDAVNDFFNSVHENLKKALDGGCGDEYSRL